ncbi:MAG: hypothetical protein K2M11_02215, partial [Paramuribaculum sp.]|nr:hypothetical protein [Paramuribaculum sp.]
HPYVIPYLLPQATLRLPAVSHSNVPAALPYPNASICYSLPPSSGYATLACGFAQQRAYGTSLS